MGRPSDLLDAALARTGDVFARDTVRLGLLRSGLLDFGDARKPSRQAWELIGVCLETGRSAESMVDGSMILAAPLEGKGGVTGVLLVERVGRPLSSTDRRIVELLASHLSLELDNTRLYRKLDALFHQFIPNEVANQLTDDPDQAALGGSIRDVTVLFADLRGFTSLSERSHPDEVVSLLNRYFSAGVPVIIHHGGTVTSFIGDAIMALFNAPALQDDHAVRAARAGLAMQAEIDRIAADDPEAPRFRVGINSGPALVGNIGSVQRRTYTAIGDTVNVASRLEGQASPGQVVIGMTTYRALGPTADVQPLGPLQVKGRAEPVEAYVLAGIHDTAAPRRTMMYRPR